MGSEASQAAQPLCFLGGIGPLACTVIYGVQFTIYMGNFLWAWKSMKQAINKYILFVFIYMGLGQLILCVNSSILYTKES